MGKKTKKTRWRTLSIGDGCSDTETSVNETSRNNQKYGRTNGVWYNSSNQKYSNQSTPVKHQHETNGGGHYHHHHHQQQQQQSRGHWNYTRSSHQETSKSTTRSSSTVSEHKIKFNEDEYTRITTPRQDVLFKKGYLSKPKPYLQLQQQRSLTSTGNSTGDGTPDHQSADGNDVVDSDYDQSPFMFPGGNCNSGSFMDGGGMFFVNGFEPYAVPPHHVLVYDQYGNAVVCLQPQPPLQPPPTLYERRTKRYSTDSMTESTSPHNESNQDAASTFNDTDEGCFPVTTTTEPTSSSNKCEADADAQAEQTRIRKKRRRKKMEPNKGANGEGDGVDVAELSSDELSSLSGEEDDEGAEGEENEDLKSNTSKCDTDDVSTTNSCKYRVDAEEFVPRCYRQQQQQQQQHMEFVPLPVGVPLYAGPATFVPTMFPMTNHQIYFNNPHHFSTTTTAASSSSTITTTTTSAITNDLEDKPDQDEIAEQEEAREEATVIDKKSDAIDIEKIVSKLEQAAKEQQVIDVISTSTPITGMDVECAEPKINTIQLNNETNKTESVPLTTTIQQEQQPLHQEHQKHQATNTSIVENVRYSERLKQSHNHNASSQTRLSHQQQQQQQQQNKPIIKQRRTINQTCPRLERSASSKPKTNINTNNHNNLKTIVPSKTTETTNASSNQWIAVSGKKKRGKNKQLLTDIEAEEPQKNVEQVIQPEPEPKIPLTRIEETIQIQEDDDKQEVSNVETKDENKQRPIKNNPKKQPVIKKRILINDDLIVANSPKSVIVPKSNLEEKTVVVPVEQLETSKGNKSKKKPNKKSKSKSAPIKPNNECNNNIDKSINNEVQTVVVAAAAATTTTTTTTNIDDFKVNDESNKKDDNDDVSLELDRMIQRGLYGNLEQRLRSFNPADSFLKQTQSQAIHPNVKRFDTAATAAASVIGTMAAAVLKKPATYFGQTSNINASTCASSSTSTNGFIPPKVIINEVESGANNDGDHQENQRFPITRAVREWMNKTRENTPEVEIFKKPNEIRQEFNLIIDQADNKTEEEVEAEVDTIENGVEIHEAKDQDHHQVDEMSSVDLVLGPPQVDVDEDLLDCWEPEISYDQHQLRRRSKSLSMEQQQQSTIVEQAEDVLETYDSVYGRSEDFAHIQREVQQQQQQQQQQLDHQHFNSNRHQQHQQQQHKKPQWTLPTTHSEITVTKIHSILPIRSMTTNR